MNSRAQKWSVLAAILFALTLFAAKPATADDDDPPTRVARLSYINGEVSFSPSGTDDWVGAVVNRPITTGDKLWIDQNSRAELHVGSAAIRLAGQTGFSFLNLDDRMMQIRLTEGTINLRVFRLGDNESIEVDTPNLAFSVLRPGRYHINVNEAGDTTIINVPDGEGEVTGGGSAYTVHPGDQGIFTGTDTLNPDIESLAPDDDFDGWCNERDLREEHSAARRYVSDDVVGYQDLDDYGGWRPVPEYGTVWFPHVSVVSWAPYRYGHWVWISPWGWTWVDDAPWGYAPFHYGRWVNYGGAWGWVPCPPRVVAVAYVRPVYAPALVAWVGGPHFAAGIGFGGGIGVGVNVGWFPLGPREVFVPSYPVSRAYINNVNVSNTTVNQTVINNYYNNTVVNKNVTVNNVTYMNQNVHGAVTATTAQNFTSAQPVGRNMVQVNEREVATAPVAVRAPSVVPPKQAVLGSGAPTRFQPPAALQSRAVVAKTAPPPAPLAFAQRQEAIKANQGQPISIAQAHQLSTQQPRPNVAAVRVAPPAKAVTVPPQANRAMQPNVNRPTNTNVNPTPNTNTSAPMNNNKPANVNTNTNVPPHVDRPPAAHPVQIVDPQLEQKHQEQIQQMQQKQDQQYQKLQQQQAQQQQKLQQQQANEEKQRQTQQQQQEKMQQLEQKHAEERQQLQEKQEQEHAHADAKPKQPKNEDKPPKNEDKPPHH